MLKRQLAARALPAALLVVALGACSAPAATPATLIDNSPEPTIGTTPEPIPTQTPAGESPVAATPAATQTVMPVETATVAGEAITLPAWFGVSLTNAVWCPKCLTQQNQVKALHALLGPRDDYVSLGLAIDPNEDAALVRDYITQNGFDWTYAVSPGELSREMALLYGDLFLNPPSTPMLIVDRRGETHPLPFGIKSAESLQEALAPFMNEGPKPGAATPAANTND
jgi:hypothetical protein